MPNQPAAGELLLLDGVSKAFGEVRAVDGVSLAVGAGESVALIGPNGAGKSTLFHLISGQLRPDRGRILLEGRAIGGLRPDRIARMGVARTFQTVSAFPGLTVRENLLVAAYARAGEAWRPVGDRRRPSEPVARRVEEALALAGLADRADRLVQSLSHAEQRVVELGLALVQRPRLLLLDEPTAGLSPAETAEVVDLLKRIRAGGGFTLMVVEHDLAVVFSLATRIVVMHQGRVIADGPPERVRRDPAVQEAYLGEVAA